MANTIYPGKYMYAIFSNKNGMYVQPCKVLEINRDGFTAECHNGGESGHQCGTEYFLYEDLGKGVFYSKDSAQVVINAEKERERERE